MKRWILAGLFLILLRAAFFPIASAGAEEAPDLVFKQGADIYARFSDEAIESSIIYFEKIIARFPAFSPAYSALAEAYLQKYFRNPGSSRRLIEKAAAAAEKALFTDARSASAHKAIASVFYAEGKIEEAIEELERAIDMVPDYARALLNLGTCRLQQKDREGALAFFREAIQADNDNLAAGIAYYNIASLEAEEKKFDSSLEAYRKAAGLVPSYYGIHYGLGVMYMNLDRDREAVKAFQEVLLLKPDYLEGHIALASAYHRLGNKPEAEKAYQAALAIDAGSEEAMKGLAALDGKKIGCLFLY